MNDETFAVILVDSTSHAMRIEKLLARRGVPCKMIPVPRQLSSDCGVCVRIRRSHVAAVQAALEESKIRIQEICPL